MISLGTYTTPPHECAYLPAERASMRYEMVLHCTPEELEARLTSGWRRFGYSFFKPVCKACQACQSVRVPLATFKPNRSQRRAVRDNADVELRIGPASVTREKLTLYDRFHDHQAEAKGWPDHLPKDPRSYRESFVEGPVPTEEWCYYFDGQLVGVGYVDVIPSGLSAIYFFHDPEYKNRSLGTLNVMRVLEEAARRGMTHAYLGYFVDGCPSLAYKANFGPNEALGEGGAWAAFKS